MQSARVFCHAIKSGSVSHYLPYPSLQFPLLLVRRAVRRKDSGDSNAPCDIILLTLIIHCARELIASFYQPASAAHPAKFAMLSQFRRVVWASRTQCEAPRSNKTTRPWKECCAISQHLADDRRKAKAGNVCRSNHGPASSILSMPSNLQYTCT